MSTLVTEQSALFRGAAADLTRIADSVIASHNVMVEAFAASARAREEAAAASAAAAAAQAQVQAHLQFPVDQGVL